MGNHGFHDATPAEVRRLSRTLVAAHAFTEPAEIEGAHGADPWRIQVGGSGDVMVVDRWRDHLPYLAIDALWSPSKRIPAALERARSLADRLGLSDVVSPPVPIEEMHTYESAGMRPCAVVATYSLARRAAPMAEASRVCRLRDVTAADLPAVLGVDARCFVPFWRYDVTHMKRFYASARLRVAEQEGEPVGYTLCTVGRDEGLLGRLCVVPEWRRRGVGTALLRDAIASAWEQGAARLVLSTQIENAASQSLYRREGFRDTGRRFAFLRFGADEG